jgi:two-component system nitrate/nitrite response regulator NarL
MEPLCRTRTGNNQPLMPDHNVALDEMERRILQLIWDEKSNRDIAESLYLAVRSVEKIRQDIKRKIGVRSTVGMIRYAIDKKIIVPDIVNIERRRTSL